MSMSTTSTRSSSPMGYASVPRGTTDISASSCDIPWSLRVENREHVYLPSPQNMIFTFSNLGCFDDVCPYQAYRVYVKRDIPYVETPERKKGNDMHSAFE